MSRDPAPLAFVASLCLSQVLATQVAPPDLAKEAKRMLDTADQVMRQIEEVRGWKFKKPVPKDVRTEAQLRVWLEKRIFEEEYPGDRLVHTQAWMKALGLLPESCDFKKTLTDVLLNQVGGFYDPLTGAFYMMAESARYGEFANRMIIAHELCHALDDQHVGLKPMMRAKDGKPLTEDLSFALGGVIEGSATALMIAWSAKAMREDKPDMEQLGSMQKSELERMKPFFDAPPYFSLLMANYIVGANFITKGSGMLAGMSGDSGAAILEVGKAPPRSSEQVLHPEKYWDEKQRDEPVLLADEASVVARLEKELGAKVVLRETLGELLCAVLATKKDRKLNMAAASNASYWTSKEARGWGGDRLFLMQAEKAPPFVIWATMWDETSDREEFVAGITKHRAEQPGFTVAEVGRLALFAFGGGRPDARRLRLAQLTAGISFVKDGKPWLPGA